MQYDDRTKRVDRYLGWSLGLSPAKQRAFAHQNGMAGAVTSPQKLVQSFVCNSDAGLALYESIYHGDEARKELTAA